ncbi:hypothetical protein BASA83_001479 [Batrachochytrium salamandrivorans]|nr:hypothetical protein BASA83_001479 [Batrachochytrium salamandrivorans]
MIPALVLVSSDQTAIQKQILADTTGQTKDSQATTLVCIDGDSTNMRRLGIAPKGLHTTASNSWGGNSTLARRLQAPVNTGIRMILKAPLFTPIAPMLTDCGIISLDAHAILARVRLTVKATTLKTPPPNSIISIYYSISL